MIYNTSISSKWQTLWNVQTPDWYQALENQGNASKWCHYQNIKQGWSHFIRNHVCFSREKPELKSDDKQHCCARYWTWERHWHSDKTRTGMTHHKEMDTDRWDECSVDAKETVDKCYVMWCDVRRYSLTECLMKTLQAHISAWCLTKKKATA